MPKFTEKLSQRSTVASAILLVVGVALLGMQVVSVGIDSIAGWRQSERMLEDRAAAALDMLEAVHTQAMLHRAIVKDDDPAVATLNGAMDQFTAASKGVHLWVVMGPKVVAYQRENGRSEIEEPRDAVDARAIDSGRAQRDVVEGWLRVTRPVVMGHGAASDAKCASCHTAMMGIEKGQVIGAYSSAVELGPAVAVWRSTMLRRGLTDFAMMAAVLGIIVLLLRATTLRPLQHLTAATRRLAAGRLDADVGYRGRKDELGTLARSLEVFRGNLLDKRRSEDAIAHMARHDLLTGLANRVGLVEWLERALAGAAESGAKVALIALDVDGLKEINDTAGQHAGDEVLRTLSRRLAEALTVGEVAARVGGDEFAVGKEFHDQAALLEFVARTETALQAELWVEGAKIMLRCHAGVAVYPDDAGSTDELINKADATMHRAQSEANAPTCFYDAEIDRAARNRRALIKDMAGAIDRGELSVVFQVQKSIATLETSGYEALVRWRHPERGMVSPAEFIPLAEDSGAIVPIGDWVLKTACAEAARWPHPCRIAVNLSPIQLARDDLALRVREALSEAGLPPQCLELEITESAIIRDKKRALHMLQQIKEMGVKIGLDDFGVGYSSLETLHAFPFDKIKLDRSFVVRLGISVEATAFIRAIVTLGHSLGMQVLAEGVETSEQLALLRLEECDEVQGYLFGRPGPVLDVSEDVRRAS